MNTTLCAGCPDNVVITMPGSPYTAGDEMTCSSDGYPAATYTWTVGGVAGSTTSTQTLQEGAHEYICTATVTSGTTCDDTETISVTAFSKCKKQYNTIVTILMLMTLSDGKLAYYYFLKYYFSNTLITTVMPLGMLSRCCLLCSLH